jgi:hypothetical protein
MFDHHRKCNGAAAVAIPATAASCLSTLIRAPYLPHSRFGLGRASAWGGQGLSRCLLLALCKRADGAAAVSPVRRRPARAGRLELLWAQPLGPSTASRRAQHGQRCLPSAWCRPGVGLQTIPTWTLHRATPLTTDRPRSHGVVRWPQQEQARIGCVPAVRGGNGTVTSASRCRTPCPEYPECDNRADYC